MEKNMTEVFPTKVCLFYGAISRELEGIVFYHPNDKKSLVSPLYPEQVAEILWWGNIFSILSYRSICGAPAKILLDEKDSHWYQDVHEKWMDPKQEFSAGEVDSAFLNAALSEQVMPKWKNKPLEGHLYLKPGMPRQKECSGLADYGNAESFLKSKNADCMVFGFRRTQDNLNHCLEHGVVVWSPDMDSIQIITDIAEFFEYLALVQTKGLWMGTVELEECGRIQSDIAEVFRSIVHSKVEHIFSKSEVNNND